VLTMFQGDLANVTVRQSIPCRTPNAMRFVDALAKTDRIVRQGRRSLTPKRLVVRSKACRFRRRNYLNGTLPAALSRPASQLRIQGAEWSAASIVPAMSKIGSDTTSAS